MPPRALPLPLRLNPRNRRRRVVLSKRKKPNTTSSVRVTTVRRTVRNRLKNLKRLYNNPTVARNAFSTNSRRPAFIRGAKPITQVGMSFLKCAFAPPDFAQTQVQGIPDSFRGQSLLKKHRFNGTVSFGNTNDYYIILSPVPGVSYFIANTAQNVLPTSATVWTAVYYSDFTSFFGTNDENATNIVNSFRFVSNHIELISSVNQMSWSGSIAAWKMPLKVMINPSTATSLISEYTITGLQGTASTNSNRYTGQFFDGFFGGCFNLSSEFSFSNIIENLGSFPTTVQASDWGQFTSSSGLPGFDNCAESMVVKISGVSANETAILRTWACVEYTVNPNTSLYEYSTVSPPEDETAMKVYREVAIALPIGVTAMQNGTFWQRVLQIISAVTGAGAVLPGPYGSVSRGVNLISSGMQNLLY
jgi:hypothetical protein